MKCEKWGLTVIKKNNPRWIRMGREWSQIDQPVGVFII